MNENKKQLSFWRVFFGLLVLVAVGVSSVYGWRLRQAQRAVSVIKPWFAGYADVTSTPRFAFEHLGTTAQPHVMLAFIVSSKDDPCVPAWGSVYDLEEASVTLDLDRRIARLQQQGGQVAVSFGGAINNELALTCTDEQKLLAAYVSVVNRYNIDTIDLDLENSGLTDMDALERRARVIAQLQQQRRSEGKNLAVWLTIPVAPQGLTEQGTTAVSKMLSGGVDLAGINVMTMDYGGSKTAEDSMYEASRKALVETHRQLGILYTQAGTFLNDSSLWRKIGATPMIGQNDVYEEVFTEDDAKNLNVFALEKGIGRMSMWSANRDIPCGDNYVDVKIVSDSCSGVKTEKMAFANALGNGFTGSLSDNSEIVTVEDTQSTKQIVDDPEKSPYQIWTEVGAYLAGAKVVWHGNVYEAKWWTKGDMPDNPVLQSWETPWQLIGPVLPGEKPIPQFTLPKGTYPQWDGRQEYQTGDIVLFEGIPFQSKWWNQGQSPAAAAAHADSSPWVALTQKMLEDLTASGSAKKN